MSMKPGKLVWMNAVSSTLTGLSLAKPHHQSRHRDAMIHVGRDHSAARDMAFAMHDQVIALDLDINAVDAQHVGGCGEAVGFLHAQFFKPRMRSCLRQTPPQRRAPDIRRSSRARARGHLDTFQRGKTNTKVGDILAALVAAIELFDIRAHLAQRREQAGAQRIEHHAVEHDVGAGTIRPATSGNAADDGSAGTVTARPPQVPADLSA